MPENRTSILKRFREKLARGEPIIGAGAGTGISAKCEKAGGIDLIVIYNSGRFRMAGRGSLAGLMPYGNANDIVKSMAPEVLTIVQPTPVLAGVCGTDPFLLRDVFLRELKEFGFAGIQNFPTVGLMDGTFRANIEATGMSYQLEVECIAAARALDLLTTPYVFTPDEARRMTEAGADIVVAHMGLTTGLPRGQGRPLREATCPDPPRSPGDGGRRALSQPHRANGQSEPVQWPHPVWLGGHPPGAHRPGERSSCHLRTAVRAVRAAG
jgi:predicted TIM-barrel enzyme